MKILLVSDWHPYSTYDVFIGYYEGFRSLGVPIDTFDFTQALKHFSEEDANGKLVAKTLIKENGFTHVLYVAATMIPPWVLESKYDKKIGFIATDDPHSAKLLTDKIENVDYYFTNERALTDVIENTYYLPTAVNPEIYKENLELDNPHYKTDICFIGSVYPNRIEPLERCVKWALKNNKRIMFAGPVQGRTSYGELFVPPESILHKFVRNSIFDNQEAHKYYANTKVCINLRRDPTWSPAFVNNNPHFIECEPYSTNPRTYEIAACNGLQLHIDPIKEVEDLFGDNCYYCLNDNIESRLDEIFSTKEYILKKKIKNCFRVVQNGHTYTHRAAKVLETFIRR